jgi:hypothetical protein
MLTGGAQLHARPLGEALHPEFGEEVVGGTELLTRVDVAAPAPDSSSPTARTRRLPN